MNAPAPESPPSPPKKRAWFQLHLGTCVVLMCVVGGFLLGNFDVLRLLFEDPDISEMGRTYGFPFAACLIGGFNERWDLLAAAGNLFCLAVTLGVILHALEGPVRQAKPAAERGRAGGHAPPNKRAWFQFHLSTCVVLMLAAGALVWVNVRIQMEAYANSWQVVNYETRGWPWQYQHSGTQYREWQMQVGEKLEQEYKITQVGLNPGPSEFTIALESGIWRHPEAWSKLHLAADLGVASALLVILAVLCEAQIRRRARA